MLKKVTGNKILSRVIFERCAIIFVKIWNSGLETGETMWVTKLLNHITEDTNIKLCYLIHLIVLMKKKIFLRIPTWNKHWLGQQYCCQLGRIPFYMFCPRLIGHCRHFLSPFQIHWHKPVKLCIGP